MKPIDMLKNFMGTGGSPEQLVMKAMMGNNSNPMINNLIKMAQKGNATGVENFARNFFNEKGRDFDKEFAEFMQNFKK